MSTRVIGDQDYVNIGVTGVKGQGSGRQTVLVNHHQNLQVFLQDYGEAMQQEEQELPSWEDLRNLAGKDKEAAMAKLSEIGAALTASGAKSPTETIMSATMSFLEKEKGFVISDTDPGKDVFYISPNNLTIQVKDVPGDGATWFVAGTAPFG